MLKIENLHATEGDEPILKGLDLAVNAGEAQKPLRISLKGRVG